MASTVDIIVQGEKPSLSPAWFDPAIDTPDPRFKRHHPWVMKLVIEQDDELSGDPFGETISVGAYGKIGLKVFVPPTASSDSLSCIKYGDITTYDAIAAAALEAFIKGVDARTRRFTEKWKVQELTFKRQRMEPFSPIRVGDHQIGLTKLDEPFCEGCCVIL